MRVLVTGATGFVGRALVLRLLGAGHEVQAWTRDVAAARNILGPAVSLASDDSGVSFGSCVARADAIVHLAGENLFSGRWSEARKELIRASRIEGTRRIARALAGAPTRDRVFVSASAVGYFGDRGDEVLTETSAPGHDFLAGLCVDWEDEAMAASSPTTRVALMRLGMVLGSEGGALARLLPLFRAGLGGRLGRGTQWMSWIHLHDLVSLLLTAIEDERYEGVHHAVAPEPVTNRQFTAALSEALSRPALLAVPGFVLGAALGEASGVLLGSQRAVSDRVQERGFSFAFPTVASALAQVVDPRRAPRIERAPDGVQPMPGRPAATYVLEQVTRIGSPLSDIFPFFSLAENLALLTPRWTDFHIVEHPRDGTVEGSEIVYRLSILGVPIRWRTLIAVWEPGARFVDTQLEGPYRLWWHEHVFTEEPDGTVTMVDRVS